MTPDRFLALLCGPLSSPQVYASAVRLSNALFYVVAATGDAGDAALEAWCKLQEQTDRFKAEMAE